MTRGSWGLFAAQIAAHLSIVPMVIYASGVHYFISFIVYFLTGCIGMSMAFHRLIAHRSWNAPNWFRKSAIILGSLGLTGSALAWAAVHRDHHRGPDTIRDPHSPYHQPWWRVQFLSMFYSPRLLGSRDLVQDRFLVWTHRNYFLIQAGYMCLLWAIDPFAIVYAYLFPAVILWHAGSSINTLGHFWGYKNFPTRDESRNNLLLGWMMWGEGWHNNHHRYPSSANFSVRPWEIDISNILINRLRVRKKDAAL